MNISPFLSVLMITYNHRPYLEKAVQGVLTQKADFPFELLIAEDWSKDGTRDLAFELQRRHPDLIQVIASESNVGMHANLARVERGARGKYVAYCEGDDFWNDPHKLAKQVAFLESRPDYTFVHSHCHRYVVAENRLMADSLKVPRDLNDSKAFEDILLGRRSPLTVTVMARRDELNQVLENCPECTDPIWPMADTQRWLELSRRGKVGCIHESLATHNWLPESAGQSRDPQKRLKFYSAAREIKLHYLRKYPVAPEIERSVKRRLASLLLNYAFQAAALDFARELYLDYRSNGGRPDLRIHSLLWGSVSRNRQRWVQPVLWLHRNYRRLIRQARLRLLRDRTALYEG
ncbi:MAG TPA: glycosyltransferase [Verrucomicrobiae bacterium]|nr:glycosyltransferase [Verrucomicrobiae bacterium]